MTPREKFQGLMRELFQFDMADLDFGIYRIMNHKRQVIERWLTEDLPRIIEEALRQGALADQQRAQQALAQARQKVVETLGEGAIDAEGNLDKKFADTNVGKEYLAARQQAALAQPTEALETAVYNHLYTFFSRYYQNGDFISKRRYSKKERYAIPYNGEEVYLYWANHDQYYVKTAEHFTDYTWKAPGGVTVRFKLKAADVEVNNVKGAKRFFIPLLEEIGWDADTSTLTIPFHYRPLTVGEEKTYGKAENDSANPSSGESQGGGSPSKGERNGRIQEAILSKALKDIPAVLSKVAKGDASRVQGALNGEHHKDAKDRPVSHLEHHLRQYTARNTRDFFIHKDLRGFLSRELDFYLKNEVLNLEELEAAGENLAEGWFQLMRLIKRIGNHIIDFLAQIEDFQKALWEKKKFVTETFWCITVGHIPEAFYPEIAENEAQWQEWRDLFHIHELPKDLLSGDLDTQEGRIAFLKAHPTLVLDTRHFSQDFTDRLLASFENLDEMTDGLLVHSENWQALNLLLEKYRERVKCIYIDPPYNTGNDEFLYRDSYQHSSWLAMMNDRLALGREWMREDGAIFISVDDNENDVLGLIGRDLFDFHVGNVVVHRKRGRDNSARDLSKIHDYLRVYGRSEKAMLNREPILEGTKKAYKNPDNDPRGPYRLLGLWARGGQGGSQYAFRMSDGYEFSERLWLVNEETMKKYDKEGRLVRVGDKLYRKLFLSEHQGQIAETIWTDVSNNANAADELKALFGVNPYSTPKPTPLLRKIFLLGSNSSSIILDYFAGSGTTAHAVINLNREDGGRRKFVLVEMADYFDTVLLPRIKKVAFTPEWKDGKPKRMATQEEFERGPRIVKVIRLESYEDALNNITFDEESGQQAPDRSDDEYLLRYMLEWETKKSETFLDVEKLQTPFSYKLHIHYDGETRKQPVDLPETFAYLIGLDVEMRRVYHDGERRYLVHRGTTRDGRKVAVIWRETKGWKEEDYERDAQFVEELGLTEGVDEIFVNGDSCIPGAHSLDRVFKARLFGGREV